MDSYIYVGLISVIILIGSLMMIISKREKTLYIKEQKREQELEIIAKLISHAKLHNHGKGIDEVIKTYSSLNINYNPKVLSKTARF